MRENFESILFAEFLRLDLRTAGFQPFGREPWERDHFFVLPVRSSSVAVINNTGFFIFFALFGNFFALLWAVCLGLFLRENNKLKKLIFTNPNQANYIKKI